MSVNAKMTAIADEIRTLSGTTEAMGLDAMATHIGEANDEVDSQVELLAQAVASLEGKASGGGSGEDVTAETDEYTAKLELLGTAIAELEAELEGKASGGSSSESVETCTVNITMSSGFGSESYGALVYENETYAVKCFTPVGSDRQPQYPITINNVVCNSMLHIHLSALEPSANVSGNCQWVNDNNSSFTHLYFLLSANAGETITIDLYDNDD